MDKPSRKWQPALPVQDNLVLGQLPHHWGFP
jgi:hypothetical protein